MATVEQEPLQKHTLHLYEGDYERLRHLYPEVGAAIVVRKLIRKHLNEVAPVPEIKPDKEMNL